LNQLPSHHCTRRITVAGEADWTPLPKSGKGHLGNPLRTTMKKFGLIIVTVVGSVLLLWAVAFNAHAAADSKAEIIEIEHQALDASTATELVSFYDPNDIITYDYIPGLQYVGAKAVYADVDHFFSNTKNLKGNFVDLQVETDGTMAVAHSLQHFT
jgi:hypothetical protein